MAETDEKRFDNAQFMEEIQKFDVFITNIAKSKKINTER